MFEDKLISNGKIYQITPIIRRAISYLIDIIMVTSIVVLYNLKEHQIYISVLYFFIFSIATKGKTPGTFVAGIKYIKKNEEEIDNKTIILKELFGRYITESIKILYIIPLLTKDKRGLTEKLTNTYLVNEEPIENPLKEFIEIELEKDK